MPFDWKELITVAEFLQNQSNSNCPQEAVLRSAISRAYYAAFCHARNYALNRPNMNDRLIIQRDDNIHEKVPDYFRDKRNFKIANTLRKLRIWRNQCDYNGEITTGYDLATMTGAAIS